MRLKKVACARHLHMRGWSKNIMEGWKALKLYFDAFNNESLILGMCIQFSCIFSNWFIYNKFDNILAAISARSKEVLLFHWVANKNIWPWAQIASWSMESKMECVHMSFISTSIIKQMRYILISHFVLFIINRTKNTFLIATFHYPTVPVPPCTGDTW